MSDSNERNRDNSEDRRRDGRNDRHTSRRDNQRPYQQRNERDGERSRPRREGEWKPRRDDERRPRRDGEWKPRRDDDRKPRRDDHRKPRRDGEWKPRHDDERRRHDHDKERDRSSAPRDRKYRGGQGRERSFAETDGNDFRPVRERHIDPEIPAHITEKDLHPGARNELKTLDKPIAEAVAKHLASVAFFIDDNPELAHQHAISAMRKASRIPVTRETYAITSYVTGDFATALRELRTYRRLTGSNLQLALMIDSERALGRSDRAIELGREANLEELPTDVRVQVAIAMSGARLDLGQTLQALYELEIPQLDPKRAYSWSPELFAAYAAVLEDLGRTEEANTWQRRAFAAEEALNEHQLGGALEVIEILEEEDLEDVKQVQQPTHSTRQEGERDK